MTKSVQHRRLKKGLMYLALMLGAVVMIVPFLWMLSTSLKTSSATFVLPPKWIPENPSIESYFKVFETVPMARFFFNSIFIALVSTFFQVLICAMAGYAFARIEFRGRDILFYVYLATLMVPQQVTLTPLFILMNKLGWANTYKALILPGIFSAFGTFLMRQFFQGIPKSLEEAAFIDGAGYVTIFFRIIIHLAKPVIATLWIFAFMASWNNFLWPLIITSDTAHMTLPLGLSTLKGRWETDWNVLMAGTLLSILPMLVVYMFTQKYIIKGLTHTGLK